MRSLLIILLTCFHFLTTLEAFAVEIRFQPGDVIAYREAPQRDYYSLMLHNIAVLSTDQGEEIIDIRIEAWHGEFMQSSVVLSLEDVLESAAKMSAYQQGGILELYDFYFQTSQILPEGTILSGTNELKRDEALIMSQTPMLVKGVPDVLRVTLRLVDEHGTKEESKDIPVVEYKTSNDYIFPVKGIWYNAAGAGLNTHHRWVTNEEFSLDLAIIGPNKTTRLGEADVPEDFYAYGAEVYAIAGGRVVAVEAGMAETLEMFPKDGESKQDFEARAADIQNGFLQQGKYAVVGNFVSIKHANGEFSHSVHLAEGSVKLKVGDRVKQGQVIGKLGHTGNSTEPHLHFQLTNGPDVLYSRGLPILFTNAVELFDRTSSVSPASGWMIETIDED